MAIELIDTIKPKNNQGFPIAISNDIKGGIHHVDTLSERDTISEDRLSEGMLCYVKEHGMFQYTNGGWDMFSQSSYVVDTYEDMLNLDTTRLKLGTICYVLDDNIYYLSKNGWSEFATNKNSSIGGGGVSGFYIGTTPPRDTNLLWIDTTYKELDSTLDSIVLDEFREIFNEMKVTINTLKIEVANHKNTITGLVSSNNTLKQTVIGLEDRIYNLENNVVIDNGNTLSILTEDGSPLLCEDGTYLFMDIIQSVPSGTLLTEDNSPLLTESNEYILQN